MSVMKLLGCFTLSEFEECSMLKSSYIGNLYLCTKVGRGVVYTVLLCCINALSFPVVSHLHKVK